MNAANDITLVYHDVPAAVAENLSGVLPYMALRLPRPVKIGDYETTEVFPIVAYNAERDLTNDGASGLYAVTIHLRLHTPAMDSGQPITIHTTTDFRDQLDRFFGVMFYEWPLAPRDQISSRAIIAPPGMAQRTPGRVVGRIGPPSEGPAHC